MIESISPLLRVQQRHLVAPMLNEREQYLSHLLRQGAGHAEIRTTGAYLLHIVRVMNMTTLRVVEPDEISRAGDVWAAYEGPHRQCPRMKGTPTQFVRFATRWFRFHGHLASPTPHPFRVLVAEFTEALQTQRGLAPDTVDSYTGRAFGFLKWFSVRSDKLASVSLDDIDDFLAIKHAAGWSLSGLASQCQALRAFFGYAEGRGWCVAGLPLGIRSPSVPKYDGRKKGPTWSEVRKLINSAKGPRPSDLRAKAVLLLFAVYGLRNSEVARLRLSDFDWRSETFIVRRAKRGGIQQYPIQFEVGEAILQYLQRGRPHTSCRHVFVTARRPHGPITSGTMWKIVGERMRGLGISAEHVGPHALRHSCATHLLRKGIALQEIAEFLGHKDAESIGIYARYDTRSLRKVASFSLAGVL